MDILCVHATYSEFTFTLSVLCFSKQRLMVQEQHWFQFGYFPDAINEFSSIQSGLERATANSSGIQMRVPLPLIKQETLQPEILLHGSPTFDLTFSTFQVFRLFNLFDANHSSFTMPLYYNSDHNLDIVHLTRGYCSDCWKYIWEGRVAIISASLLENRLSSVCAWFNCNVLLLWRVWI